MENKFKFENCHRFALSALTTFPPFTTPPIQIMRGSSVPPKMWQLSGLRSCACEVTSPSRSPPAPNPWLPGPRKLLQIHLGRGGWWPRNRRPSGWIGWTRPRNKDRKAREKIKKERRGNVTSRGESDPEGGKIRRPGEDKEPTGWSSEKISW